MNDKNKGNCDGQSVIKTRTGAKKLVSRRVGTKSEATRHGGTGGDATKQEEEGNDDEDDAEGRLRTFCHGLGDSARVMM